MSRSQFFGWVVPLAVVLLSMTAATDAQRGPRDEVALTDDVERLRIDMLGSMPARGRSDALVTLMVFTDFQCPFCGRLEPTLQALAERYGRDLRIVHRDHPLPFHDHAEEAAEAAREAFAQRGIAGFSQMAAILFENQSDLDRSALDGYARSMGLDMARFTRAMDEHIHLDAIDFDDSEASRLRANGTPTTYINGRLMTGAQPIEMFAALIDEEITRAQAAISEGRATRANYYARLMRGAAARPSTATRDGDRPYSIAVPDHAPGRGAASPVLVVQVFSDFQCPFCARITPTLDALVARYGDRVRFVWRNYPLPFHDHAMEAAEAAMEAFAQRGDAGFWAMHDLLFENQRDLSRENLERFADDLGLDLPAFRRALDGHVHRAGIEAEMAAVRAAGARIGTPSVLVGTHLIEGAQRLEVFASAIDEALAGR